jgi:nucleotide-binding universal stress UspA family protein
MERVNKILAPTDLSELSSIGVRHALEVGRSRNAEVIVYHVIDIADGWITRRENLSPVREMLARQKKLLDRFLREKFADHMNLVEVRQVVEFGSAFSNIVEKAKRERVDMIIMSTHGRTGLHHLLMTGSVSAKVVSRAACPVLVIPADGRAASVANAA